MNLIGLGKVGCRIVQHFADYPEYTMYKIDVGIKGKKKDGIYDFPKMTTPEECEESCPSMKNFLKNVSGSVMFFVSGADVLCAATLRILEEIKMRASITIIYVQPDRDLIGAPARLMDTAALNIFQEYARSGAIDRTVLISQEELSRAVGAVPVAEHQSRTAGLLASALHIINIMNNTEPVYNNHSEQIDIARISTIGMSSIDEEEENLLFALRYPMEKIYYYLIPKAELQSDEKLMNKILTQIKTRVKEEKIKVNFGVYETDYEDSFVYVMSNSSIVQGRNIE